MSAVEAAIAVVQRCISALANDITAEDRARMVTLATSALAVLEAEGPRRASTARLAERVRELERQLTDRTPGERRRIVCARLGISRAAFYRARRRVSLR